MFYLLAYDSLSMTDCKRAKRRLTLRFALSALLAILLLAGMATRGTAQQPVDNSIVQKVEAILPAAPGVAVLAIDRGEVVFQRCWGKHHLDQDAPCTSRSNFRLASITKQFTATAILLLAERHQLQLDDSISRFFKDAPASWHPITVRHLLTHTSGLPDYEPLIPEGTTLQLSDLNALELLLAQSEVDFVAGEKFHYSNSGYVLLGLIVESAAKKPFHEFLQSEIFDACEMNETVLFVRGLNEISNRAYGHRYQENGSFVVADQSLTSALRGDGGVYSSVEDLQKWIACLRGRTLLQPASYELMFTPQVKTDRGKSHYGIGWFIDEYRGQRRIYHNGGTRGFSLTLRMFPDRDAALVLLLNCERESTEPFDKMADRVTDAVLFSDKRDVVATP